MLTNALIEVEKRQKELEEGVLRHAPADWAAFQTMAGEWRGLECAAAILTKLIEGDKRDD